MMNFPYQLDRGSNKIFSLELHEQVDFTFPPETLEQEQRKKVTLLPARQ